MKELITATGIFAIVYILTILATILALYLIYKLNKDYE